MNDIVYKYPEKKPPFFGVSFSNNIEGMMLNANWINLPPREWNARLEVKRKALEITIYSKKEYRHTYVLKSYDIPALKKFMRETRQNDKINFGHVEMKDGDHKVIRTSTYKVWVLPITKIEIYHER